MRPAAEAFPISQPFGGGATLGVDPNGNNPMAGLVRQYGNYQPYGHAGMDIACPEGTPVYAMSDGIVLWADWGTNLPGDESNAGYRRRWYLYKGFPGIVTVIQHPGWIGVYAHLSFAQMSIGETVTEGQQIGLSGGTGGVAPHLHVEALVDDNYTTGGGLIYGRTDPMPYFGARGIAAQGTITQTEEDDMPFTFEDLKRAATEGALAALDFKVDNTLGGKTSTLDVARVLDQKFNETPDAMLDRETPRAGEFGGNTSLRGVLAYADQKHIEALRATATAAHSDGTSADVIIKAVKDALAAGVKVEATVKVGE